MFALPASAIALGDTHAMFNTKNLQDEVSKDFRSIS